MFALSQKRMVTVYAAGAYEGPLRCLVLQKLKGDILASKQLGTCMIALLPLQSISCDLIIPIPLHWTRYARRGYNQTWYSAKTIAPVMKAPVISLLRRTKKTLYQSTLSKSDRQKNLEGAFVLVPKYRHLAEHYLAGKHIVLVDDLYTTGATVKAAAQVLACYNPASITVVVACRAI
ncbi:MAG: Competence protein ComF [candidate division TM6 bacterium GW2011_GWF2_38_10]|nr:MAG: Competence protein ComF [candidate division TM6 bacterium GW2011_GWF2_38_10]